MEKVTDVDGIHIPLWEWGLGLVDVGREVLDDL